MSNLSYSKFLHFRVYCQNSSLLLTPQAANAKTQIEQPYHPHLWHFHAVVGLVLMADWQSILHDPCTDFSLFHHPEITNNLSDRYQLSLCWTAPSGCQWPTNGVEVEVVESILEKPGSIAGIQGPSAVLNVSVYNVAMNICESPRESQYHCHWIPKSIVTDKLCAACPAICRGVGHTLNFIQFTVFFTDVIIRPWQIIPNDLPIILFF